MNRRNRRRVIGEMTRGEEMSVEESFRGMP